MEVIKITQVQITMGVPLVADFIKYYTALQSPCLGAKFSARFAGVCCNINNNPHHSLQLRSFGVVEGIIILRRLMLC